MPRTKKNLIKVDETDPVGEIEPSFPWRDVIIKRNVDIKQFYDLQSEIGRGKFGTVYRCKEKATGLILAAKFVGIAKRNDRRNVEREVEIMRELQHPRLIQIYDAFESSNVMCVVLELIEGGELFERVIDDDFVLTEKAVTVFMRQICEGVEFIHSKNVLHLDMKPENILCLTKTGNRIKIIDFGLARKFDPDKKLQVLFGTPEFVAPEVVNFDAIGFGTDLWSVGVICYVLLSGLSPFMGETDVQTMANVTIANYDFDDECFNNISEDAKDFIRKLLLKDKEARMTATQCLQHSWLSRHPIPDPNLINTKDNIKECLERWSPEKQMPTLNTKKNLKQNSPPSSEKKLKLDINLKENASPNIEKRELTGSPDMGGEKKMKLDVKTPDEPKQEVITSTGTESKIPNIIQETTSTSFKHTTTPLSSMDTSEPEPGDKSSPIKKLDLPKSPTPSKANTNSLTLNVKPIGTLADQSNIVPKSPSPTTTANSVALNDMNLEKKSAEIAQPIEKSPSPIKITGTVTLIETNSGKTPSDIAKPISKSPSSSKTIVPSNAIVKETKIESTAKPSELIKQKSPGPRPSNVLENDVKRSSDSEKPESKSPNLGKTESVSSGIIKEAIKQPEVTSSEKKLKLHPPPTPEIESISDDQPKTEKKLKVQTPFTPDTSVKSPFDSKESFKSNSSKITKDTKPLLYASEKTSKALEEKSLVRPNAFVLENATKSPEVQISTTDIKPKDDKIVVPKQEVKLEGENKLPLKDAACKSTETADKLKQSNSKLAVSEENLKKIEDERIKSSSSNFSVEHHGSTSQKKELSNVPNQTEKEISEKTQPHQNTLKVVIKSTDGDSLTEQRTPLSSKPPTPTSPKLSSIANKKPNPDDIGISKLTIDDKKIDKTPSTSHVKNSPQQESKEIKQDSSIKTPTLKDSIQSPLPKMASQSNLSNKGINSSLSNKSTESSSPKLPSNPLNIPIISSDRTFQRGISKSKSTDVKNKLEKQTAIEQKSNEKESPKDVKSQNEEIIQKISELTEKATKTTSTDNSVKRKISMSREISIEKKESNQKSSTERQISLEKKEESKEKIVTIKSSNNLNKNIDANNFAEVKYTPSTNNTFKNSFNPERKTSKDNIVPPDAIQDKSKPKEGGPSQLIVPKIITHKIYIESDDIESTSSEARRGSLEHKTNKSKMNLLDDFRQDRRASDISCFFTGEDDYITEEINRLSDRLKDLKSSSFDNSTSSESLFQRIRRPKYKISHYSRDVPVNSPPPASNMAYYMRHSQSPGSQSPTSDALINFLTQFNDQADAKANLDVHKKETTTAAV